MPDQKKVTIIITSYNYEKYVGKCIESAISQDYSNKEIIIIDDKSTDNSSKIIKKYKDEYPFLITIIHEINIGLKNTLLEGLEISTGDYICRIDSDDFLSSNTAISSKVNILNQNKDYAFVYSDFVTVNSLDKILNNSYEMYHKTDFFGNDFKNILFGNKIISSGTLINMKYKGYIKEYIWDWDLWLNLSKDYNIGYINNKDIGYRLHDQSYTKIARKKDDKFNQKNQGIDQKNYVVNHGFDLIKQVFLCIPSHQKITLFDKSKAYVGCYRFRAFFFLRKKEYGNFIIFLIKSFIFDPIYYISNIRNIYFLIFNIKKY